MNPPICIVTDCDESSYSRGLCSTHYIAWFKHKDGPIQPLTKQARYNNNPTGTPYPFMFSARKLTDDDVRDIRIQHRNGVTIYALAKQHNVHSRTIGNLIRGRSYKNVV